MMAEPACLQKLQSLRHCTLVCHCHRGPPCHADIIIELLRKHPQPKTTAFGQQPIVTVQVLYLFADKRRRADIREHLERMCQEQNREFIMREVEPELHGMADDLLDDAVWANDLASLANC